MSLTTFMLRLFIILLSCVSTSSWAHKASDSYLTVDILENSIVAQWEIALRDLEYAVGLDVDGDGKITWGETKHAQDKITALALANLQVSTQGKSCLTKAQSHQINMHSDGSYAVLMINIVCPINAIELTLDYQLMFDVDRQHRGLVQVNFGDDVQSGVFSPNRTIQRFALGQQSIWDKFSNFFYEGMWHIWVGYDHILFLLSLLLPAVLIWKNKLWLPTTHFSDGVVEILKIVTAFTIAHSITLSLAALDLVVLPVRWVEAVIALSVIIAAVNNIKPFFQHQRWIMAFGFGLIHGFGFANVLSDLGLAGEQFVIGLIGFNIGVEIGQLAIVGGFLPIAYLLRRTWCYQRMIFHYGSLSIIALAAIWFIERSFDMTINFIRV